MRRLFFIFTWQNKCLLIQICELISNQIVTNDYYQIRTWNIHLYMYKLYTFDFAETTDCAHVCCKFAVHNCQFGFTFIWNTSAILSVWSGYREQHWSLYFAIICCRVFQPPCILLVHYCHKCEGFNVCLYVTWKWNFCRVFFWRRTPSVQRTIFVCLFCFFFYSEWKKPFSLYRKHEMFMAIHTRSIWYGYVLAMSRMRGRGHTEQVSLANWYIRTKSTTHSTKLCAQSNRVMLANPYQRTKWLNWFVAYGGNVSQI